MATGRPHRRDRRVNANTGETRGRSATTKPRTGTGGSQAWEELSERLDEASRRASAAGSSIDPPR